MLFLEVEEAFQESVTVETAKRKVEEAETKLRFHFNTLINEYEATFVKSQETVAQDLKGEYQRYVLTLFEDCAHLELPILEGVRQSLKNIPLNLTVEQQSLQNFSDCLGIQIDCCAQFDSPYVGYCGIGLL